MSAYAHGEMGNPGGSGGVVGAPCGRVTRGRFARPRGSCEWKIKTTNAITVSSDESEVGHEWEIIRKLHYVNWYYYRYVIVRSIMMKLWAK